LLNFSRKGPGREPDVFSLPLRTSQRAAGDIECELNT
jgi:hypothetical protein